MPLAGIGSRFIALLVDYIIWFFGVLLLFFLSALLLPAIRAVSRPSWQWTVALAVFIVFLVNWGYFTLFDRPFGNGAYASKRVAKIPEVIQRSGRAIGLFESMARNLIRYVDQFPFPLHVVGVVSMFVTGQHQRLGDLAAGTLVVRDREEEAPMWGESGARTLTAPTFAAVPPPPEPQAYLNLSSTGIAKLTSADLEVLEGFFSRRLDMALTTREALAARIAAAIQAKSGLEPPPGASVETFLEATARQLRDLSRLR